MEFFYRTMRKNYNILMEDENKPDGGQWNYDKQNRKPPPKKHIFPKQLLIPPDEITRDVMALVEQYFFDHFGDLEPFHYAVTTHDAQMCFEDFVQHRLPYFGDYQDAMLNDEPYLYHSHIGQYLNSGLLDPLSCCRQVEQAYRQGRVPLAAAEGFIRQIMGWREYVRGIYWLKMPDYKNGNYFEANRQLPWFYWSGETKMQCMRQCVKQTREYAYAHHIQRLMVTGAFALMAGIHPDFVNEWYMIVYSDAYEWVELPNVTGMILFADGGYMASKPYAASGKYINRMSNYCKHCQYDVNKLVGDDACPFNYLYWNFIIQHKDKLAGNQRMALILSQLNRMPGDQKIIISHQAKTFLDEVAPISNQDHF